MSALAGLLSGHVPPGAYHYSSAYDLGHLRHVVEHAGWTFAHLDGVAVETVPDLHAALAEALALPAHYGRNLDALADCLRDVRADTVLLYDAWSPLARAEPRVFALAVGLLGERISVLLCGPGPQTGLPTLPRAQSPEA